MARLPRFEILYETFNTFIDQCILGNQSLIWPQDTVWTLENVTEVRDRLLSEQADPNLSFQEKLEIQMSDASMDQWKVICDIFYIYFLPSSYYKIERKLEYMNWAAQRGGLSVPDESAEIWEPQTHGFTRTSQRYHSKYRQFFFILKFAEYMKTADQPEVILGNPNRFQETLDEILIDVPNKNYRAYDMRHAMLFLTYPERFERIISTGD